MLSSFCEKPLKLILDVRNSECGLMCKCMVNVQNVHIDHAFAHLIISYGIKKELVVVLSISLF